MFDKNKKSNKREDSFKKIYGKLNVFHQIANTILF